MSDVKRRKIALLSLLPSADKSIRNGVKEITAKIGKIFHRLNLGLVAPVYASVHVNSSSRTRTFIWLLGNIQFGVVNKGN